MNVQYKTALTKFWIILGCNNPSDCKCDVNFEFKSDKTGIDQLKTTVDVSKDTGFLIELKNEGLEPAYDMEFQINSTVLLNLPTAQSDCEFEGESSGIKVVLYSISQSILV